MDNGPEMTGKAIFFHSTERGVKLRFIQPGKPRMFTCAKRLGSQGHRRAKALFCLQVQGRFVLMIKQVIEGAH